MSQLSLFAPPPQWGTVPGYPRVRYEPAYPDPLHARMLAALFADDPVTGLLGLVTGLSSADAIAAIEGLRIPRTLRIGPGPDHPRPFWGARVLARARVSNRMVA